jgi:hypothetical protein
MTKLRLLASSLFIVIILSQTSPEVIRLWYWESTHQTLVEVPATSINDQLSIINPVYPENKPENCIELSNQKLTLKQCNKKLSYEEWQSPENWIVSEAIPADLNRDGVDEIALVVWRPFAPWPIDRFLPNGGRIAGFHDKAGLSAHLILVGWDGDEYRELWAGSALANPISTIRAIDIDRDGYEELVAVEGVYDAFEKGGNITIWRWQGFGFTLLDRMEGNYSGYEVYHTDQQTSILTY